MRAAAAFSDRVYVLRQGAIVAAGGGAELVGNEAMVATYPGAGSEQRSTI